ncbi:SbcC/MukB-like Walker B domain-containing protein [Gluconacetobacter asukensis]|uniref:DNA primase n=1 Tax=Gluconacetobacter asukensis TaxID=1017181 RepID=A0A7W4J3Y1_9PROT|nr:SbcC/MukB-like Walker B domain-containing protein [Gluconacetobacter asukensis]MBB2174062.1 DNA primase [Gluconacetobacter asukensis]
MMELRRIVLVNWHMMTRADLDLAGDVAILGQNRSGKSTIIDLIQAIMAGGSARLFKFNRSAGEGGSRSERTLGGYCLGQLNEDTFLRNQARTHIALVFEDPEERRMPVSLGLSIEAARAQQTELVGHFVAEGVSVKTEMLLDDAGGALRPAPWPVVRRRLGQACDDAGGQLLTPDDARTFIREYMRALFTGRRMADPDRFVRIFVAALSFTDLSSVEQFVHRYLLEPKPIDIADLRESIGRYREIQKTIADLNRRLDALRALHARIEVFGRLRAEEENCRAVERTAMLVEAVGGLFVNIRAFSGKSDELRDVIAEFERVEADSRRENETLDAIRAQRAAADGSSQRVMVEQQIRELDRDWATVMERLQARYFGAARAVQLLALREKLGAINPGELLRALERVEAAGRALEPPDWPKDPDAMEALLAAVSRAALDRAQKATARRDEAIRWVGTLTTETDEDREKLANARRGQVTLNAATTRLMDALRREGMRPRTLCEVADVVDERWRNVLEALLTRDREAVIVDPEHAYRATEILRHGRDAYSGCRVANTRKLQSRSTIAESGTLASMIRSDDPLAMAFVVFRIGNVQLAEDQEELLSGGRAVMADGAYYDGLITEMRRADGLKIGRAAAPLMEAELQKRIEERTQLLAVHRESARFFEDVTRRLEECGRPVEEKDRLGTLALALGDLGERRAEARRRLESLSAQVDPRLADAEQQSKARLGRLRDRRDVLIGSRGSLTAEIAAIRDKLHGGEQLVGSYLCVTRRRRLFREVVGSVSRLRSVRDLYAQHPARSPARIAAEMAKAANEAMEGYRALEREIRSALGRYAIDFPDALEGYAEAPIIGMVGPWVSDGITMLEGNELIRYRAHADEAADRVSRLFRTTFIHELNSRFGQLKSEMEKLSAALRTRPLHGETYRLVALVKPEFEDLHHFAQESESDQTTLDALFGRAEPRNERHARALRQVEQLLADESFDFTSFQDYRSYFTYDLRMRDIATGRTTSFDRRRGVASGAERQVPFYVVIGAALASAYHGMRQLAAPKAQGMGLAVFDEAFSKMDGSNQRTLLDFYRAIGLQVVIAAPTEKRAVVYENLDTIIDVFRSGDVSLAESIRIKDRVRTEMRAANPQHATDEQLAEQLDLEMKTKK